jgi:hypothetical protein
MKLEIAKSLDAWVELMRVLKGSMWVDTFMASVVQVKL